MEEKPGKFNLQRGLELFAEQYEWRLGGWVSSEWNKEEGIVRVLTPRGFDFGKPADTSGKLL